MIRVVLDTAVIVAGFRSRRGAANKLLEWTQTGQIVPLASPALFLEYEAVLKRAEQRAKTGLTLDEADAALRDLIAVCEPVIIRFRWRPQTRDPDDDHVLQTGSMAVRKLW